MVTSSEVVSAARLWLGTPFAHQHRARGIGVDCAGLLIGVGRELGLFTAEFDVEPYSARPDGATLRATCDRHLEPAEACVVGGIVLIAWGSGPPQHLGIVGTMVDGMLSMIHAEGRRQHRVIEQRLAFSRATRFVCAYKFCRVQY